MERLIKTTKYKLIIMLLASVLPIIFIAFFEPLIEDRLNKITWDMVLIRWIIFVFFEGAIIWKNILYFRILSNTEYAEQVLVKRKDERLIFVKQKTFTLEYKIILFVVSCALVVTGFINPYIFYTLLAVNLFILISAAIVKLYYNKKY